MPVSAAMEKILAAVAQITSTTDLPANLAAVERTVRLAASRGARLVLVPENFAFIGDGTPAADQRRMEIAESLPAGGPIVERMARLAMETRSTLVVLSPEGKILVTYRKIHLFDVSFADGPTFRESKSIVPGTAPVLAALPE